MNGGDKSFSAKCLQMYHQSKQNMNSNAYDLADEVIVRLYDALQIAGNKEVELRKELRHYATNDQQRRLADACRQVELLSSQVEKMSKGALK